MNWLPGGEESPALAYYKRNTDGLSSVSRPYKDHMLNSAKVQKV
jgi:hypothetical protein